MSAATSDSLTEVLLGFYALTETTGASIAAIIPDVVQRLQLRDQTHDGAGNMSGLYDGAQASIRCSQLLALYASRCISLASEGAIAECK